MATALFLLYVSGQFRIEIPGLGIPITLQSMLVVGIPLVMSRIEGVSVVGLYLLFTALGVPLLAGGVGGHEYFFSESGGYLYGFFIVAILSSFLKNHLPNPQYVSVFASFMVLQILLSLLGVWFIQLFVAESTASFESHVSPFLLGIVVKSFLGTAAVIGVNKLTGFLNDLSEAD